ncbi:hypothetical protein LZ554_002359 [Drepanopeziza brunnea f. sp. 'monogermtubi']|nr:hypothetical protein LZ554_002359 [Drepanopeziza brunnea f. sp. 'monogermtubi']
MTPLGNPAILVFGCTFEDERPDETRRDETRFRLADQKIARWDSGLIERSSGLPTLIRADTDAAKANIGRSTLRQADFLNRRIALPLPLSIQSCSPLASRSSLTTTFTRPLLKTPPLTYWCLTGEAVTGVATSQGRAAFGVDRSSESCRIMSENEMEQPANLQQYTCGELRNSKLQGIQRMAVNVPCGETRRMSRTQQFHKVSPLWLPRSDPELAHIRTNTYNTPCDFITFPSPQNLESLLFTAIAAVRKMDRFRSQSLDLEKIFPMLKQKVSDLCPRIESRRASQVSGTTKHRLVGRRASRSGTQCLCDRTTSAKIIAMLLFPSPQPPSSSRNPN